jgi:hypothetical protein
MRRINLNLFPKDGYYFIDRDGTRLNGENWNAVIARVADYRKRNGFPPGNPDQEVHEQACEHNPAYCSEITEQQREMTRVASLKGRVLGWLSTLLRSKEKDPLKYVDDTTAKNRADVCIGCPKNVGIADGCSSCKAAVAEYRRNLLGHRPVRGRLNGCVLLGEDLPVSTHLDQQTVDNSELPAHCWRKRTV